MSEKLSRLTSSMREASLMELRFENRGKALAAGFKLCVSFLQAPVAERGCKIVRQVGSYIEIEPVPSSENAALEQGQSWEFCLRFGIAYHEPLNVSWGPAGAYVVDNADNAIEVEALPLKFPDFALDMVNMPVEAPGIELVPSPAVWNRSDGQCDFGKGFAVSTSDEQSSSALAAITALAERNSLPAFCAPDGIRTTCQLREDGDEQPSHRIEIKESGIDIVVNCKDGFLHAFVSLAQLRANCGNQMACGVIEDRPRFSWRGQHLDCARHYYGVSSILRLLDMLALLKLNRFHWHFIDDEAFRLELDCTPELARQTRLRGHGCLIPALFGGGMSPTGGSYSKEDVALVLARAAELGIEVMPEIELPAHALALLKVLPAMRDPKDQSAAVSVQGYPDNVINPAMPATWEFLNQALPEVAARFPLRIVHLGCDEIPPRTWTKSPALEKWKKQHNLADATDVQERMMQETAQIVRDCNARPAAWEEAIQGRNGGIGNDAVIFGWRGIEEGLDAARAGHDVVMCPAQHVYFDMAPNADPSERGINWAAQIALADTIAWEPVPADEPELAERVIGVQGALWSETVLEDSYIEPMLMPRMLGLSEMAWAKQGGKMSVPQLRHMARRWRGLLATIGWTSSTLD